MRSIVAGTALLVPALAVLLLGGCGAGGGTDVCFWDAYGSYACGGTYYDDPYYDDPWYPYDPWYKPAGESDPCAWLRFSGNANDFLVLDASDDVVRFAATAPHVLEVGPTRARNLQTTLDGTLWLDGTPIGRVALVPSPAGGEVATLLDGAGRHLDLRLEAQGLVLVSTDVLATGPTPASVEGAACDGEPAPRMRLVLLNAPADDSPWADLPAELTDVTLVGTD